MDARRGAARAMEQYGRYELIAKLATGGMAQVFLARQSGPEGFEKRIVVKRILPHLAENEEFVQMFLQEARVAARLNHPGIAQILDLGKEGQSFFIAMEYVHGEDFRRVVRQAASEGRALPVPLAVRMVIGACEGLDFAHGKHDDQGRPLGIVHRDVSPQNLLVTFEGQVKVIDFGIAKAADSASHTRTGVLKGKYSYMSPEQAEGRNVDRRSDVFALGVVLYELVTQQRLFKRQSDLATLQAVIACEVPRPSTVNPSVDPELEGIMLRALAKDRDQRTPTAGHLQLELEEYLRKQQLAASTAHLRAFLREIYADRLAEEARLGRPLYREELKSAAPPASSFEPERSARPPPVPAAYTASRDNLAKVELAPMPRRTGAHAAIAAPPLSPSIADGDISEVSRAVRQSRSRRILSTTLVLVLIAFASAAAVLIVRPGVLGMTATKAQLRLRSSPNGAEIFVDGQPTGQLTPASVALEPGRTHVVSAEKDGFEPASVDLPAFSGELARELVLTARKVGAVRIETTPPGATVLVDGRALEGRTPTIASDLDATKPHEVVLSLAGHADEVVSVELTTGRMTTLARTLKPLGGATQAAQPARPQQPRPTTTTETPSAARAASLTVTTRPAGLTVQVDGKPAGQTPLKLDLEAGKHEVRFLDDKRLLDETVPVTLAAGDARTLEKNWSPRKVRFNVKPYATVYVRDRDFAESPGDAELYPGTYRVTYSCPELRARRTETLVVPAGDGVHMVQGTLREGEGYE